MLVLGQQYSALQHDCSWGVQLHLLHLAEFLLPDHMRKEESSDAWRQKLRDILYSVTLVLYASLLISLLTVARKIIIR